MSDQDRVVRVGRIRLGQFIKCDCGKGCITMIQYDALTYSYSYMCVCGRVQYVTITGRKVD